MGLVDPRPLARVVTIIIWVWLGSQLLYNLAMLAESLAPAQGGDTVTSVRLSIAVAVAAIVQIVADIASVVVVGRWIWRTNANAHGLSNGLSVTPGWAVGWFFIPVANLFKPFQAMRETWQVSHDPANWPNVPVPPLLRWWWGLWIVASLLGNLAFQLSRNGDITAGQSWIDVAEGAFSIAAGLALLRIVRDLSAAQSQTIAAQAFL